MGTGGQEVGAEVGGAEKIYRELLARVAQADLPAIAAAKDLPLAPGGRLGVASFARSYLVDGHGVAAADAGPVSFSQRLGVVRYVLAAGAGEPSGQFVPLRSLGGRHLGRERFAEQGLKRPLLARFGDDYPLFAGAARKVGGVVQAGGVCGEHVWRFRAFPKVPIRLTFQERDEDFPADLHVWFERKALDFLGLDCLGFLPAYFAETLLEAAASVDA